MRRKPLTWIAWAGAILALIAYASNLWSQHAALGDETRLASYDETAAADAFATRHVLALPTGIVLLGDKRDARATWHIGPVPGPAAPRSASRTKIFLTGRAFAFYTRDAYATVSLGTTQLARIVAIPRGPSGAGPYDATLTATTVDVPPRPSLGWEIDPGAARCSANCTLTVHIHRGAWDLTALGSERFEEIWPPISFSGGDVARAFGFGATALILAIVATAIVTIRARKLAILPAIALVFVLVYYAGLLFFQAAHPEANARSDRLERLGTETTTVAQGTVLPGNTLLLTANKRDASATWQLDSYEIDHLLDHSPRCAIDSYLIGDGIAGTSDDARAHLFLDGRRIGDVRFGHARATFQVAAGQRAPIGIEPTQMYYTPLNQRFALQFRSSGRSCATRTWQLRLDLHHATWRIERVGSIVHFTPTRTAIDAITLVTTCLIVGGLGLGIAAIFFLAFRSYGIGGLGSIVAILCVAPLTHDEWDFHVWLRFVDLLAFGKGDPAYMWAGSPLWPFMSIVLAPIVTTFYSLLGTASEEIPSLFLKVFMGLALVTNASAVSLCAEQTRRRLTFFATLLAPVGLYELAGGYRETFAGTFALAGLMLARRDRYIYSAFAFAIGTSISESLAPLLLLPATLACFSARLDRPKFAIAAIALIAAVGTLAIEWLVLLPHNFAGEAIVTRVVAYRYGGASWFAVLDQFDLLPSFVGPHSLAIVAALFVVLSIPVVVRLVRLFARIRDNRGPAERAVFGAFVALVAALFFAYRGIDPNDWYVLFITATFYFVSFAPTNPFPIFFGALCGLAFYTIVGLGDFVNWSYFFPVDRGLLGVLGPAEWPIDTAVNLTVLALYAALALDRPRILFGSGSAFFGALFIGAVANAANAAYLADATVWAGAIAATASAVARTVRGAPSVTHEQRASVLRTVGTAAFMILCCFAGLHSSAAIIAGLVVVTYGSARGFGLCDVALVSTTVWLLNIGTGFGYVSILGWIVLSLLAAFTLYAAAFRRYAPLG